MEYGARRVVFVVGYQNGGNGQRFDLREHQLAKGGPQRLVEAGEGLVQQQGVGFR